MYVKECGKDWLKSSRELVGVYPYTCDDLPAADALTTAACVQAGQQKQAEGAEVQERLRHLETGARALRGQIGKILDDHKAAVKRRALCAGCMPLCLLASGGAAGSALFWTVTGCCPGCMPPCH